MGIRHSVQPLLGARRHARALDAPLQLASPTSGHQWLRACCALSSVPQQPLDASQLMPAAAIDAVRALAAPGPFGALGALAAPGPFGALGAIAAARAAAVDALGAVASRAAAAAAARIAQRVAGPRLDAQRALGM